MKKNNQAYFLQEQIPVTEYKKIIKKKRQNGLLYSPTFKTPQAQMPMASNNPGCTFFVVFFV